MRERKSGFIMVSERPEEVEKETAVAVPAQNAVLKEPSLSVRRTMSHDDAKLRKKEKESEFDVESEWCVVAYDGVACPDSKMSVVVERSGRVAAIRLVEKRVVAVYSAKAQLARATNSGT